MITITVNEDKYEYDGKESLLELLRANAYYVSAPCNGRGRCGKCAVTIMKGFVSASEADKQFFSKEQITSGMRLACTCYPKQDITVHLEYAKNEEDFEVVTEFIEDMDERLETSEEKTYSIAVDIGTTTIAAVLVDDTSGKQLASATGINHQRAYGADVISRIQAANEGKLKELSLLVKKDLVGLIDEVLVQAEDGCMEKVTQILIGANTTMTHLLMEYSCETLGVYPFTPVNIAAIETKARDMLGENVPDCILKIVPGISTYVGGDIVSGIYLTGIYHQEHPSLLIDLGTNGEMALAGKDKILVTSTAAGPAFEGGNISCGTGSIRGAVSDITIKNGASAITLIGGDQAEPAGICGTGVVAITAALLEDALLDETGAFEEAYEENGYPFAKTAAGEPLTFTQKDVREIQLAKAAVCAGIEILIERYGITKNELEHVYIAGGFGLKLDAKKALRIGLLPNELADKIVMVGNSCLGGLVQLITHPEDEDILTDISEKAIELSLAADEKFNELYIENMYF
ncbi:MAG: ASKHA domain-containing protein [Hespellia sp.]|nr:ASKHA domain-containing protein [Hespellia sp.]